MQNLFHPAVENWFRKQFDEPTEPQSLAWPLIKQRRSTLIAAPTGSGKTLSAFLAAIDDLVRQGLTETLEDQTSVVYVSPLKALSNDIQKNLQIPLKGIEEELLALGLPEVPIRTLVRTGDTPASERAAMTKKPPHIFVTTPESLYILLTSESGRRILKTAKTLIVDEIHALVDDKRGSHLSLSIERLEELTDEPLVRIGLSATQKPIEEVARFLVGAENIEADGTPRCAIIDTGHRRKLDLAIELPASPLSAVMSGESWDETYDRLAQLVNSHRTTLIFVNTRRLAERVSRHLGERIGDENVAAHHGSLAREQRLSAEQKLKNGELSALVATASLELGIDIGAVDLVCQIGSTKAIATLLQRVGRSGHTVGGFPRGRLFPLSRDELVECAALIDSVRRGELDHLQIPEQPLDILAQQIVASVAAEEWTEDRLFAMARRAYPYRNLERKAFDDVIRMLAEGFSMKRGRRSALIHHDAVNKKLRGRRGSRLFAITSGGAIPDTADYNVVLEPAGTVIGTVNEDFAVESLQGDVFQLGNTSWRVLRVERGVVRVEDAKGQPPSIPFWLGEAPGRSDELSYAVSRLRSEVGELLLSGSSDEHEVEPGAALLWLENDVGVSRAAAEQIIEYLAASQIALGVMPTHETIVLERFFDESGGMQLVVHAPFGSRINRAWGLSLRKRFCTKFNFELQAAANEDAIVISLGHTHSFPLEDVFQFLHSNTVRDLLTQALLDAPMFGIRWRWNATRALAVLRRRGGTKVPPQLQRMQAEDLLAAVFPDQLACAENLTGQREIPDHPLVNQTIRDCLEEAMDIEGFIELLRSIESGEKQLIARDMVEPSPLAQEILNARPYSYLDDAPLEERRTQAVISRRWLDPESAADIGALDVAAIERVRREAWPDAANEDELHEALVELGFISTDEIEREMTPFTPELVEERAEETAPSWRKLFDELVSQRRAAVLQTGDKELWIAAERLPQLQAIYENHELKPQIATPAAAEKLWTAEAALVEVIRGRLEALGPVTVTELARQAALAEYRIETALLALESEGFVLRGRFTPGTEETEWCARRLLARIHRYTLNRLRQEIEPVSSADLMRFLLAWHKILPEQVEGPESLVPILEQLEGFEAPAAAWEGEILPARISDYDPAWLDSLCLSGQIIWARLTPPKSELAKPSSPIRTTPIALLNRKNVPMWNLFFPRASDGLALSNDAAEVLAHLRNQGASFFSDIVEGAGLLKTRVEDGLGELVAAGLVTADSFTGLRALLTPSSQRTQASLRRRRRSPAYDMANAGRWSLLIRNGRTALSAAGKTNSGEDATTSAEHGEKIARILLRRYGVVFKRILERESLQIQWRQLLKVYRRLEARGEIRGGRFVAGVSGEQFALAEAVGMLRSIRRAGEHGLMVSISAADPLNLVGITVPGQRVLANPSNRILYRDGIPIAVQEAGEIRFLVEMDSATQWRARNALVRRAIPPQLRSYLGRSA